MGLSRQPDNSRPVLRIVGDDAPISIPDDPLSVNNSTSLSPAREIVAELKFARAGAEIVKSLVETETRSSITVPSGMTDQEALRALNSLSERTTGRHLFSDATLLALDSWATVNRPPLSHRRTYPIELFVEATAARDAWEAYRALSKVRVEPGIRLQPADPMEAALVFGAHVLYHRGETTAQHLELRTACEEITLTYFKLRREIMLSERDPATRHDTVLTAASPIAREPSRGILGSLMRFFKRDQASA
jgi:hypothetical protein